MKAVLRYLGAKNKLVDWIIPFFPEHSIYVEPFGGSAAVLLNKKPAKLEVYNDAFDEVVSLFEVIRSCQCNRLAELVFNTPFAETEYKRASKRTDDKLENARRFLVRSLMGVSTDGVLRDTGGFKAETVKGASASGAKKWASLPDLLIEASCRLKEVYILNRQAVDVITKYDSTDTLFYIDPPYMMDTRTDSGRYVHEFSYDQHSGLLDLVNSVKGKVVISGYDHDLYKDKLSWWRREEIETESMRQAKRKEIIWMNYEPEGMLF